MVSIHPDLMPLDPKLHVLTGIQLIKSVEIEVHNTRKQGNKLCFLTLRQVGSCVHKVCGAWVTDIVKRHHDITSYLMVSTSPTQLPPHI